MNFYDIFDDHGLRSGSGLHQCPFLHFHWLRQLKVNFMLIKCLLATTLNRILVYMASVDVNFLGLAGVVLDRFGLRFAW